MIDIVYTYAAEPTAPAGAELRHRSVQDMQEYLDGLVFEMKMAGISAKLTALHKDGAANDITINGKRVAELLQDLQIKTLEYEEGASTSPIIKFDRAPTDWDGKVIEDISDTLMKNAISKAYADASANQIL